MPSIRRALLLALATAVLAPAAAQAASFGTPVALDAYENGNPPQVVFDPASNTTFVAWQAPNNLNNGNGVEMCVLPAGATAWQGGSATNLVDPIYSGTGKRLLKRAHGNLYATLLLRGTSGASPITKTSKLKIRSRKR